MVAGPLAQNSQWAWLKFTSRQSYCLGELLEPIEKSNFMFSWALANTLLGHR
jgi:hypothetical protein